MSGATLHWAPETVSADPYNAETPSAALDQQITPAEALFVRDHFGLPRLNAHDWRLHLGGTVDAPYDLRYDELLSMPQREFDVVLECAGNGRSLMTPLPPGLPWGERAVGCAGFAGVPFREVAARAGIRRDAVEVVFTGADSGVEQGRRLAFERSLPLAAALHPDTLLATHMNGAPLTPEHGAPVRLVVPGRYGVSDVKWLVEARAVAEPFTGFFQTDEYVYRDSRNSPDGPVTTIRVKSLIVSPEPGAAVRLGEELRVRGRAWSNGVAVRRVEVRADEGDWYEAALDPPTGRYAWTGWSFSWTPQQPGRHRLQARATDATGDVQPLQVPWNSQGYGCNLAASVEVVAG